jgi:hypothetical protein
MWHKEIVAYLTFVVASVIFVSGQDAAVVNPKIVNVGFENQYVRILRARYAPHERLEMHSHPAKAEVQITDRTVRIFTPDGKWRDDPGTQGNSSGWRRLRTRSRMSGAPR